MARVLVVLALLFAGAARADSLTFQVDLWSKDKVADATTKAMMAKITELGSQKTAKYRLKGTHQDVIDAMDDTCVFGAHGCEVTVGEKTGVDYMVVGFVESHGAKFMLTLEIYNIATKKRVRSFRDLVPMKRDAKVWAKDIYERAFEKATGELVITTSVKLAEIWIDGQMATWTYESRATMNGLAIGLHVVEVRAHGYKPFKDEVAIDGLTPLSVLLDPIASK